MLHSINMISIILFQKCQCRTTGGPTGAILMCVVGGKMSEGINFSDDLGRYAGVILFFGFFLKLRI